jgi:hypothetical protein
MLPRSAKMALYSLAVVMSVGSEANAQLTCQSKSFTDLADRTEVNERVRLDRIRGNELLDDEGRSRRIRHRSQLFMQHRRVRRVVRRIPDLWRRQIPSTVRPTALRVEHRLRANGIDASGAVSDENISHQLPIVMRRIPPRVVCKREGKQIVEGGVILEFPLNGLPAAGRYQVQIETNVELP